MNNQDQKWLENLELFREYVELYNKLPTYSTIYKDITLGQWMARQKTKYKQGRLSEFEMGLINKIIDKTKISNKLNQQNCANNTLYNKNLNNKKISIDILNCGIEKLDFSSRIYNCLKRNNINTVQEIIDNLDELPNIKGLGKSCFNEIQKKLYEYGFLSLDNSKFKNINYEFIHYDDSEEDSSQMQNTECSYDETYKYFIVYTYIRNKTINIGNCFITSPIKIINHNTIKYISELIEKGYKVPKVTIVNYFEV